MKNENLHDNRKISYCRLILLKSGGARNDYYLKSDETTIGRSPQNSIVLKDTSVSRVHACVIKEGGHYRIVDMESANGILVNRVPVKELVIKSGDRIQIGDVKLIFFDPQNPVKIPELLESENNFPVKGEAGRNFRAGVAKFVVFILIIAVGLLIYFYLDSVHNRQPNITGSQDVKMSRARSLEKFADESYRRALELMEREKWREAESELLKVVSIDPAYRDSKALLAKCQAKLQSSSDISESTDIEAVTPASAPGNAGQESMSNVVFSESLNAAKELYIEGKVEEAISEIDAITQSMPDLAGQGSILKASMTEAREKFIAGEKSYKDGDAASAIMSWDEVKKREKNMGINSESYFAGMIRAYLAGEIK